MVYLLSYLLKGQNFLGYEYDSSLTPAATFKQAFLAKNGRSLSEIAPNCLSDIARIIDKLKYESKPDYSCLRNLLKKCI